MTEDYTLILKHTMRGGISSSGEFEESFEIEPPIVLRYIVNRMDNTPKPILVNGMMERFTHDLLSRLSEVEE